MVSIVLFTEIEAAAVDFISTGLPIACYTIYLPSRSAEGTPVEGSSRWESPSDKLVEGCKQGITVLCRRSIVVGQKKCWLESFGGSSKEIMTLCQDPLHHQLPKE